MQRYESYKPSGIQWVEKIPSHWGAERAKWLFDRMERPVRPEDDVVTAFRDGQVTLRTNRRTEGFTNAIQEHGYQGIRKGDLVIHAMDAFAGAIGVSDSDGKSTPVYAACVPRGEYPVNSYYYAYLLRYMAHSGYIESLSKGIRERSTDFRFSEFRELPLPIPDKDEQDRIVAFLNQKAAEIDATIAKKERLIELLEEQRMVVINRAVTEGLTSGSPTLEEKNRWFGSPPKAWSIKRLRRLANCLQTGPFGSQLHQDEYVDGGVPVINPSHLVDGFIQPDSRVSVTTKVAARLSRHALKAGDIVFGRRGEMGRCGLVTEDQAGWLCGTGSILFRPNELVSSRYISISLSSSFVRRYLEFVCVGSTLDNLNTEILGRLPIPVPPMREQEEIVDWVESIQSEFRSTIFSEREQISLLFRFKQAVIANAVTGQIKV